MEGDKNQDIYNFFEAQDGNLVWAGALTLAWKELIDHANSTTGGGKLKHFDVDPQTYQQFADNYSYS